jgi:arginyl-tRNA synthetase
LRVVELQRGDESTIMLWRRFVDESKRHMAHVYARLGVLLREEDVRGESYYNPMLGDIVDELTRQGLAIENDGALCVFLPGFTNRENDPLPLIVRKQDGGYGYATTDLAAIRYRTNTLGATRILYVVGSPQQQHFAMVFETAKQAGWLRAGRVEHVMFGSMLGADKKMYKTRSGQTVKLTDLLDEAVERALSAVEQKNPDLDPPVRAAVAERVGIGAIKYADLSSDRIKDYVFDWDRMLAFEGNTGPYLMYAHARIRSILRKAAEGGAAQSDAVCIEHDAERRLAIELLGFDGALTSVDATLQPHRLCTYLYDLATAFTAFYENCPVLRADTDDLRASRLGLCELTAGVLSTGLELLGIEAPDRM